MLASIQLNSNRPQNISEFIKNVEDTTTNPDLIEIIFHIDNDDSECQNLLDKLKITSKVKIKYLQTDIIKGYKDLWKPLNEILKLTDPKAYFVTNFSDEFRFETKGWDDILKKYIGYYEDDIFRIRLSRYRFRNYTDFWECIYAPDSLAFYTKKWMDTVNMWCPCLGPDSWQQLVAFYLINSRKFDHIQYNRDIAESFIKFSGEGASVGLTGEQARRRIKDNVDLWFETVSCEMQEKAKYAAAKLQTAIIMHKNYDGKKISRNFTANRKSPLFDNKDFENISYKDNPLKKQIEFFYNNNLFYQISYKINKFWLFIINNIRKPNYGYYAGGGQECFRKDFVSQLNVYFRMRRYGVYTTNYSILKKPNFVKKYKLGLFWILSKTILFIAILFINKINNILRKIGINIGNLSTQYKFLKKKKLFNNSYPNFVWSLQKTYLIARDIINKISLRRSSIIFYTKIIGFFLKREILKSLPRNLRIKLLKSLFFSFSKKKLIECNREIANFWFRAGYADEMAEILKITLDYKFSPELMYNYFGCLLFTSPSNYTHKKYIESMLHYTDKFIPYNKEGSFRVKDLNPNKKLKVGYICHFFSNNISQQSIWPWISHHDKNNFDIYVLSDDAKAGVIANDPQKYEEFKKSVNFIDTSHFDSSQFCQFIIDGKFDILLELNGYCDFNRYIEINQRIAPIQISFYNISGPTGIRGIDYILHNPNINTENIKKFYTEKFYSLNHITATKIGEYYPQVNEAPFLKNGYITFGSFGASHKVSRDSIKLWCNILKKVPNSKIFIKAGAFYDKDIIKIFKKNFAKNNISGNRIKIEGFEPHKEMLKKYHEIDIALDTIPYCAGTTTVDALYMGIPVIALNGERLCSQHAKMILGSINHTELLAYSESEYFQKAVELANDKERIINYRKNLRAEYNSSNMNNVNGFIKDLENSYRSMWKKFLETKINSPLRKA